MLGADLHFRNDGPAETSEDAEEFHTSSKGLFLACLGDGDTGADECRDKQVSSRDIGASNSTKEGVGEWGRAGVTGSIDSAVSLVRLIRIAFRGDENTDWTA